MSTVEDLAKRLIETEQKLAAVTTEQATTKSLMTMMTKSFMALWQSQHETARAQQEVIEGQLKVAEEERGLLREQLEAMREAIQQISHDLPYRPLEARLISYANDGHRSKDREVKICTAWGSNGQNNQRQRGGQENVQSERKHTWSREHPKDKDTKPLKEKRYSLMRGRNPVSATGGRAPVKISSNQKKNWTAGETALETKQKIRKLSCGRLRSHKPNSGNALKERETKASDHHKAQRSTEEAHHSARNLPRLEPGQGVRIQNSKTKLWDTVGVIVRAEAKQRNYLVKVDMHVYIWRNRRFLRPIAGGETETSSEHPSTSLPMTSTRGRRRLGDKKSVTFQLPDSGGTTSTSAAPRRSQRKKKSPDRLGILST